ERAAASSCARSAKARPPFTFPGSGAGSWPCYASCRSDCLPALTSKSRTGPAILVVAALSLCMGVAFFPLPADDAYIVARYTANIASGRSMVFNEGEAVNALTSPFHLVVLFMLQPLASEFVTVYRVLCAVAVATVLVACA